MPDTPPLPTVAGELVFVSSPTARCGTTLLQRLLGSSPDALIFGEGVGGSLIELVRALAQRERVLERAELHRRDLGRFLAGEQFWCPHLLADPEGFVGLFAGALERFVEFHQRAASAHGRPIWGAKHPAMPVESLRMLLRVVPGARLVYVVRELAAAARSAKARNFVRTLADLEHFARTWREGVAGLERLREELRDDARVLVVDYARLEVGDSELLSELEGFTGARGLDRSVLQHRVNTWDEEGGPYLEPGWLDGEELAVLEAA